MTTERYALSVAPAAARAVESQQWASAAVPLAAHTRFYRADIDGLRAVAVVSVLAYHAFPGVLPGGFTGVDVFFVISGYLITQLILEEMRVRRFRLLGFYARRARRILPSLAIVLAVSLLFGWYALLRDELVWLGRSVEWSAAFMANLFFARAGNYGDYFDPDAQLSPALHLWSLGVEEQFYLAWPLLMLIAVRMRLVSATLVTVTVVSLALSLWGALYHPNSSFYLPTSRGWELAIGGLLAAIQVRAGDMFRAESMRRREMLVRGAVSIAGAGLILGGMAFLGSQLAFPGGWGLIPSGGAALLIAAGAGAPANRWLLATSPMIFIGRISYPLYLWHWPIFSYLRIVTGIAPTALTAMAALLGAAAAAYLTCRLVEEPIRFGKARARAVPFLFAALAALALCGAAMGHRWITGRLAHPPFSAWDAAVWDWKVPSVPMRDDIATFGAASERRRTTVFIGDSHIQQYWPRVQGVISMNPSTARSAVFATYIGCPPLPELGSPRVRSPCSRSFAHALAVARRDDVDTVVFGGFWEDYFTGEYREPGWPQRVQHVYLATDPLHRPLALDSAGTRIALDEFGRTIAALTASGRRVFIVLSNPTSPRFDPHFLFPAAARLELRAPARLVIGEDKRRVDAGPYESYVAPLMDRLRQVASAAGATVIDPRASLCQAMSCAAVGPRGALLYLDSNHLTATFAREHASFIDQVLFDSSASTGTR